MLRATFSTFSQVDISSYNKVKYYIKRKCDGHKPKKSATFTKEQLQRIFNEAPDDIYLNTKVAAIFGISGVLRRCEFGNLTTADVTKGNGFLLMKILIAENKIVKTFTSAGEMFEICKQYLNARPAVCKKNKFFLHYHKGKMINQPIMVNKFGSMPKEIALFLGLPNAKSYTGHSFRRTSATLLVDAGADLTILKRHGGWKSSTVAEGYIADSVFNNKKLLPMYWQFQT
ncbi:hypothetical protein TKK_0013649 [Trichogramma kaykai]